MYYVYVYYDPTMKPIYVGVGTDNRAWDYISQVRDSKLKLKLTKITPVIELYKTDLTQTEALELQRSLIQEWGRRDIGTGILYNHNDGDKERKEVKPKGVHRRPVTQLHPLTGIVMAIYDGIRTVSKDGFNPGCVAAVINGTMNLSGGYKWKDTTPEDYNQGALNVSNN